jgi:hypothetical protein
MLAFAIICVLIIVFFLYKDILGFIPQIKWGFSKKHVVLGSFLVLSLFYLVTTAFWFYTIGKYPHGSSMDSSTNTMAQISMYFSTVWTILLGLGGAFNAWEYNSRLPHNSEPDYKIDNFDPEKGTIYNVHFNGGTVYQVEYTKSEKLIIWGPGEDDFEDDEDDFDNVEYDEDVEFTQEIKVYKPTRVFIGKSPMNAMTRFSGGYGDNWDGNTILAQISKHGYVFIGDEIYEFSTVETIEYFVSPVGNSGVGYPVATSTNLVYLLGEKKVMKKSDFPVGYDLDDAPRFYYDHMQLATDLKITKQVAEAV